MFLNIMIHDIELIDTHLLRPAAIQAYNEPCVNVSIHLMFRPEMDINMRK